LGGVRGDVPENNLKWITVYRYSHMETFCTGECHCINPRNVWLTDPPKGNSFSDSAG